MFVNRQVALAQLETWWAQPGAALGVVARFAVCARERVDDPGDALAVTAAEIF